MSLQDFPKSIGTVVWNVLHNEIGKIHISAPANRVTPIMKLSTYFHKRKMACYINRQFGVLKRESRIKEPNRQNCLRRNASNGANSDSYYPNIIESTIVRKRRLPARENSAVCTFLLANYMIGLIVSVKVVSITLEE